MSTDTYYTVLVFVDYRKEVEIDILKVFPDQEQALVYAHRTLEDAKANAKIKYGREGDDEEENEDGNLNDEREYVFLRGKKLLEKKMATYRDFFSPILAVVEVDGSSQ